MADPRLEWIKLIHTVVLLARNMSSPVTILYGESGSEDDTRDTCLLCLSTKQPLIHSTIAFADRPCNCSYYFHIRCLTSTYTATPAFASRCLHCNMAWPETGRPCRAPTSEGQEAQIARMYERSPPIPSICSARNLALLTGLLAVGAFFYLILLANTSSNVKAYGRLLRT